MHKYYRIFLFIILFPLVFILPISRVNAQSVPIEITTIEELNNIRNDLSASYILMNNLDFNDCASYSHCSNMPLYTTNAGWEPIGDYSAYPASLFNGNFDGQNYTINNLFINRPTSNYVGLFGFIGGTSNISNINLTNVNVSGSTYSAGLVGVIFDSATVNNTSAKGDVISPTYGAVLAGYIGTNASVSNSTAEGHVTAGTGSSAMFAAIYGTTTNSFYSYDRIFVNGEKSFNQGVLYEKEYNIWISNGKSLSSINIGNYFTKKDGYYLIKNLQDIKNLLPFAENTGYKFKIVNDLDFSGVTDLYIISFSGILEGNNRKILNFTLSEPDKMGIGFIANNYGTIRNLYFPDVNVTGQSYVGGVVGHNKETGRVVNVHVTGTVEGTGYGEVGGVVGLNRGYINNSSATDIYIDSYRDIGGLVGLSLSTGLIENSFATGTVIGNSRVGMLAGENHGVIKSSYVNEGTLTSTYYTGGFVGRNYGQIFTSFTNASVFANDYYAGGFVGYNQGTSLIEDSYATGDVTKLAGGTNSGGYGAFIGVNADSSNIKNCYSIGSVIFQEEDNPTNRGFAASSATLATEANSFFDVGHSNQLSTSGTAIPKSTLEMKSIATFIDTDTVGLYTPWSITTLEDFDPNSNTIWYIEDGNNYPRLNIEFTKPQLILKSPNSVGFYDATLNAEIKDIGTLGSAKIAFQYRKKGTSTWNTTSYISKTNLGSISKQVSNLYYSTTYEFRTKTKYGVNNYILFSNTKTFKTLTPSTPIDKPENDSLKEEEIIIEEDTESIESEQSVKTVTIQVLNDFGEPFKNAEITFLGNKYISDSEGAILINDISPAEYDISLIHDGQEYYAQVNIKDKSEYKVIISTQKDTNYWKAFVIIFFIFVLLALYLYYKKKGFNFIKR